MMKTAELRRLIRAHNVLSKITIPKGATASDIVKLIEAKNYIVDHEKKELRPKVSRGKIITLKTADEVLPKPKTTEQKAEAKGKREKKVAEQKKKELDIKAEGVKQGATLQRVIAKKKARQAQVEQQKVEPKEKKVEPKKTTSTMGTQTDEPKPKPKPKPVLKIADKTSANKDVVNKALRKMMDGDFRKKYNKNIYQALEIPNNSDPSKVEVKEICRKLKLKYHPDKGGSADQFTAIKEACDIMTSSFKKSKY